MSLSEADDSNLKSHGNLCAFLSTIHYVKAFITICLPIDYTWFTKSFELLIKIGVFSLKLLKGKYMTTFTLNFNSFMNSLKYICVLPYIPCNSLNIPGRMRIVTGHHTDLSWKTVTYLAVDTNKQTNKQKTK